MREFIDVGFLGRIFHLGIARVALLSSKALLFLSFGFNLQPQTYGSIAVLLALGTVFSLLLEFGVGSIILRQGAYNRKETQPILGGLLLLRLALLLPVSLLYLLAASLLLGKLFSFFLAIIVCLYALTYQIGQTLFSFLQGIRKTKIEGTAMLLLHALESIIILWWWQRGRDDLVLLMGLLLVVRMGCITGLWLIVIQSLNSTFSFSPLFQFLKKYKHSIILFGLLSFVQFTYIQADIFLLKWLRSSKEVGEYWACYRLLAVFFIPIDLLLQAIMPQLKIAQQKKIVQQKLNSVHTLGLLFVLPLLLLLIFYRHEILSLFLGKQFKNLESLFLYLTIGLGIAYLPPFGSVLKMSQNPWSIMWTSAVAAGTNILLNILLIPHYGTFGAAWATIASYTLMKCLFWYIFTKKELQSFPNQTITLMTLFEGLGLLILWNRTNDIASFLLFIFCSLLIIVTIGQHHIKQVRE